MSGCRTEPDFEMPDHRYTLIIPTYNRPQELELLVQFLQRQGADFPVVVLDSSAPAERSRNRSLLEGAGSNFAYEEYEESTHPFDKFRDGLRHVRTPFCQFCADDDLILVDGVRRCVDRLAHDDGLVAAHGLCFVFQDQGGKVMEIPRLLYYTPDNLHPDPVVRLRDLFRHYQALFYAVYRREVLEHIFTRALEVQSLLARELLSGALTVVQGGVARIQAFSHGRGTTPSNPYRHWHPFELLIRSPESLFEEYIPYRDILVDDLSRKLGLPSADTDLKRRVDLIHMLYLARHMPEGTLDFAVERVLAGDDFETIWSSDEILVPLQRAAEISDPRLTPSLRHRLRSLMWDSGRYVKRRFVGPGRRVRNPLLRAVRSPVREYRLHPEFFDASPASREPIARSELQRLVNCMDMFGS